MDLIRRFLNCSIQFFFSHKSTVLFIVLGPTRVHDQINVCLFPLMHTHSRRSKWCNEMWIPNSKWFFLHLAILLRCSVWFFCCIPFSLSLREIAVSWCYSRFRYFLCLAVAWFCANKNRKVCNICRISLFLRITAFFGLCIMLPWFGSAVVLSRFCR